MHLTAGLVTVLAIYFQRIHKLKGLRGWCISVDWLLYITTLHPNFFKNIGARKTLTPRFIDSFTDFEKKNGLFCSLGQTRTQSLFMFFGCERRWGFRLRRPPQPNPQSSPTPKTHISATGYESESGLYMAACLEQILFLLMLPSEHAH